MRRNFIRRHCLSAPVSLCFYSYKKMPRSPKVDQVESAVLAREWLMATCNPIVGTDKDALEGLKD